MSKNRILLVEDDEAIREGVGMNLVYAGYAFAAFADGDAAAAALGSDRAFDLALLDIMLPGRDGFSLFDVVRSAGIPVIFMTAKTDSASEIRGLREGAEDYIIKPFDILTLLVRIEKVLERTGRAQKTLTIGDVTLDAENRIVRKCGIEVPLMPLEYEVLALLLRCKNRTIPRERLLNEVWGVDFFGGTRTVDVHIANLRRKLGLKHEIRTITKVGYRLEDAP